MTWLQRYRLSEYFRRSLWVLPVCGMVAALMGIRILHAAETAMGWESPVAPANVVILLGTLAGAMFTLIVFICSALLIMVQLATAQLTPRVIALVLQSRHMRLSLALFVFSFTFTLASLIRINDSVPSLTQHIAAYSCLVSLGVFFYLVDRVCTALRPSGAMRSVVELGNKVIDDVYPLRLADRAAPEAPQSVVPDGGPQLTLPCRKQGVLLAFDLPGLVALAQRAGCVIEIVPQVGDFVAVEQPLFRIHGVGKPSETDLYQSIALGLERTMRQDSALALRILVDIALKGLSPAINDPSTAVLAIGQIQHLLRRLGTRRLDSGLVKDSQGELRLIYPTPDWEDFVHLASTEIRHFGGSSIQVARRMRAMFEGLMEGLPEKRAIVLRQELDLLVRSAHRFFAEAEDRALADVSDVQGVGGKPSSN